MFKVWGIIGNSKIVFFSISVLLTQKMYEMFSGEYVLQAQHENYRSLKKKLILINGKPKHQTYLS